MKRYTRAFTLIELLVVISIIGILSTIVMTSLSSSRAKGRDARRIADVKSIQLALSLYFSDNLMYPKNIYAGSSGSAPATGLSGTYMPVVPTDPSYNTSNATCASSIGNNGCYGYVALTAGSGAACSGVTNNPYPTKYKIGVAMEDTKNSALLQDVDAPVQVYATHGFQACSSGTGADFDGTTAASTAGTQCSSTAGTAQPNGTEVCFDQTP